MCAVDNPPADIPEKHPLSSGQGFVMVTAFGAFFVMGLAGAMATTLVPIVPVVFGLGLAAAMAVQWIALVVSGLSSLMLAQRLQHAGPRQVMLAGLALIALGCLAVALAIHPFSGGRASYGTLIAALAMVALGIAALQVAANLCVVQAGHAATAAARLTFAQACNSVGVLAGVSIGAGLALGSERNAVSAGAALAYMLAALVTAAVLAGAALARRAAWGAPAPAASAPIRQALRSRRAWAGAATIALYVGAEGTTGGLLIPYLHERSAFDLAAAGQLVAWVYWGGALLGRVLGSVLLMRVPAPRALGAAAVLALACTLAPLVFAGPSPGYALLATGLCNAIMFPVIFALTLEHADAPPAAVSGLLSTAIAGGAVMSAAAGYLAEHLGLAQALALPALAYGAIAGFAAWAARLAPAAPPQDSRTTNSIGSRSDFIS